MPRTKPLSESTMSFGDHLDELRRRVLLSLAAPLPLFLVLFFVSDPLLGWLLQPVYTVLEHHDLPSELQVLSPPEYLVTKIKLSFIAAIVISGPWIATRMDQGKTWGTEAYERTIHHPDRKENKGDDHWRGR